MKLLLLIVSLSMSMFACAMEKGGAKTSPVRRKGEETYVIRRSFSDIALGQLEIDIIKSIENNDLKAFKKKLSEFCELCPKQVPSDIKGNTVLLLVLNKMLDVKKDKELLNYDQMVASLVEKRLIANCLRRNPQEYLEVLESLKKLEIIKKADNRQIIENYHTTFLALINLQGYHNK